MHMLYNYNMLYSKCFLWEPKQIDIPRILTHLTHSFNLRLTNQQENVHLMILRLPFLNQDDTKEDFS